MYNDIYKDLKALIQSGHKCVIITTLLFNREKQGTIVDKRLVLEAELNNNIPLDAAIQEKAAAALDTGKLQLLDINSEKKVLIEPFMPKPRLLVFGGGHIAKPLVELASKVGFSITMVDDRPFFANCQRFSEADRVICEGFEKSFGQLQFRESDYVVIITRGHKHDGVVLREVLNYDFSYVGMIGSKRRVNGMREELSAEGYSLERLAKVNAPIGIDISAITPEEIAVSIIAQLISYKNKGIVDRFGKSFSLPEFDAEVAQRISEQSELPKALITILSSKGSVPRKASAKMVAYYDGTTVGSIGGGCSEAGVISSAKELMLSKGFLIEHVDMTGEVAESEGMVCGGTMEVLVEVF